MNPVIVCIAKREHDYIEEFVRYHLALGFKHIYLYDNENIPTYNKILEKYLGNMTIIHLPGNNYDTGVQYIALRNFVNDYLFKTDITHVAHIDIDEFIVLKKHANICEFINEYIVGDCQAIGMNWRFFGSSGRTEKTNEPVTLRFTKCEINGNRHIKTLFKKDYFLNYISCHCISLSKGYTKSTNGTIINSSFNNNIDFSVIQLNHYRAKTLPEFIYARARGRADIKDSENYNSQKLFNDCDINEIEELSAHNFYKKILNI